MGNSNSQAANASPPIAANRRYITPEIVQSQQETFVASPWNARAAVPSAQSVPIESATRLKTDFYIKTGSLVVYERVNRDDRPWEIALDFASDCKVPCLVSCHAVAVDMPTAGPDFSTRLVPKYPRAPITACLHGSSQQFFPAAVLACGEDACAVDTRLYQLEELTHVPLKDGGKTRPRPPTSAAMDRLQYVGALIPDEARLAVPPMLYPFVITLRQAAAGDGPTMVLFVALRVCEAGAEEESSRVDPPGWRRSNAFSCKLLRTAVQFGGSVYEISNMYGMAEKGKDTWTSASDCVVCLSEQSTHASLPCGHVCLCSTCATQFRTQTNKCPVCRAPVLELLRLQEPSVVELQALS